jgi:hypothetical protein
LSNLQEKLTALDYPTPPPSPQPQPEPTAPLSEEDLIKDLDEILTATDAKEEDIDKLVEEKIVKTNDEEQKKKIRQNSEYKKIAIKLENDQEAGERGKELAKILTTNLDKSGNRLSLFLSLCNKLEEELEKFTNNKNENSVEYKIYSNSRFKSAIEEKLSEVRRLKSELKKQLKTQETLKPNEINYPL